MPTYHWKGSTAGSTGQEWGYTANWLNSGFTTTPYLPLGGDTVVFGPSAISSCLIGGLLDGYWIGYTSGTQFFPTVSLYGDGKASSFLRAAKNQTDSVDIIVIGDSNAGSGAHGWSEGLAKACLDNENIPLYSTSAYQYFGSENYNAGLVGISAYGVHSIIFPPTHPTFADIAVAQPDQAAGTYGTTYGWIHDGFSYGNVDSRAAQLREKFNVGIVVGSTETVNRLQQGSGYWGFGFSVQPQGLSAYYSFNHGRIQLFAGHPFRGNTFTYRSVHSTGLSGGTFYMNFYMDGGVGVIGTTKTVSTNNGQAIWDWTFTEHDLNVTNPANTLYASSFGSYSGHPSGNLGIEGNVAFLLHSAYRKIKGFAVNQLMWMGGRTTTQLADTLKNNTPIPTLATYLKEIRNRQIAAGGSGKIIFFITGGGNDSDATTSGGNPTPQQFLTNIKDMVDKWKEVCNYLSISENDYTFLILVSHPQSAIDKHPNYQESVHYGLTPYRSIIAEKTNSRELSGSFVNFLSFGGTFSTAFDRFIGGVSGATGLYDSISPRAHFGETGYVLLSQDIIRETLNYVPSSIPASQGDITVRIDSGYGVTHPNNLTQIGFSFGSVTGGLNLKVSQLYIGTTANNAEISINNSPATAYSIAHMDGPSGTFYGSGGFNTLLVSRGSFAGQNLTSNLILIEGVRGPTPFYNPTQGYGVHSVTIGENSNINNVVASVKATAKQIIINTIGKESIINNMGITTEGYTFTKIEQKIRPAGLERQYNRITRTNKYFRS